MNETHFKNFIVRILRRGTYKWAAKYKALERCKIKVETHNKDGTVSKKYRVFWKCEITGAICSDKEKVVDHINPVVPLYWVECDWDWKIVIENMFCDETGLQVISKKAHAVKTKAENEIRRDFKKGLIVKAAIPTILTEKIEEGFKKLNGSVSKLKRKVK